jgi:hypothetical protein
MPQTTVISIFKYQGIAPRWNAFTRMGFPPLKNKVIPGLQFWKALGSGGNNGFSVKPDFSVYALLTVFDNEETANAFCESNIIERYLKGAIAHAHIFMHNAHAHGMWSQKKPFETVVPLDHTKPLCVITRATIKPVLALKFWNYVPTVSAEIENFDGLIYSKGVGEWPIFMQATFSIWESADAMMAYAYKNKKHAEMVKKTRELGWYKEELFSRFHPFKQKGNLIPSFL